MWRPLVLSCLASAGPPLASPEDDPGVAAVKVLEPHPAVTAARKLLGQPYRWNGRGTAKNPGIDCLGLLFLAFGEVDGRPWSAFAVDPYPLVKSGLLGQPVPGLDAGLRSRLELSDLRSGDVLYFLLAEPGWGQDFTVHIFRQV